MLQCLNTYIDVFRKMNIRFKPAHTCQLGGSLEEILIYYTQTHKKKQKGACYLMHSSWQMCANKCIHCLHSIIVDFSCTLYLFIITRIIAFDRQVLRIYRFFICVSCGHQSQWCLGKRLIVQLLQ